MRPFRRSPLGRLYGILSSTADGGFAVDPEGKIIFWNASAERILGFTATEVVGEPCDDVLAGRDAFGNRLCHQSCHVLAMVRQAQPVQPYDLLTRTKGGKSLWINVSILVVPASRQELQTTVHLFRDVTASHRIEELVKEAVRPEVQSKQGPATDLSPPELTRREHQILRLMASGANTRAIAQALHVSPATVRNHIQNLLGKLEVHSRLEAVAYATRHHLLESFPP